MSSKSFQIDDPENFKILVATDIHLGFQEKNLIRADDSFNTFEEVLQLAKEHNVDFILLGGDLFHVNQPSMTSLERCVSLLRTYCLGDKPINMEILSDQAETFKHCNHPIVNFEDQNLNVSIPVFSIHGNHDDPCGYREISCMDLLSSIGLINYFGKQTSLQELKISPILLQKGSNKIALYGLSHIRDERLERLFRNRKVRMYRPQEDVDQWFNIFVCHQNRFKRPGTKYLSENVIPDYMMLTIWGHEHECLIDPVPKISEESRGYISQPGSTIATSLCEGEAGSKHVGLLRIKGQSFNMEPLELKTVRLMHFETIKLSECDEEYDVSNAKSTQEFIKQKIEDILIDLSLKRSGHHKQPKLPLIRLKIEYTNEIQYFNCIQFGQQFQDRVANFNEMILLKMEKKPVQKFPKCIDDNTLADIKDDQELDKIEQIVDQYFRTVNSDNKLQLLSVNGMAEAVDCVVNKSSHSDAIEMVVKHQIKKVKDFVLKQDDLNEYNISEYIASYRNQKSNNEINEQQDLSTSSTRRIRSDSDDELNISHNEMGVEENTNDSPRNTRNQNGRERRGRGSRAPRTTRGRGKGQTKLNF